MAYCLYQIFVDIITVFLSLSLSLSFSLVWECWKLIARESTRLLTCYNETQLHVHFQFNQTLIKEETDLTATVAHYNSSLIPYTHIFCMNKFIWGIPVVWFLGCVETENSTASEQITWETVGNVIVHLFSYNNESNEVFGCDSKMVNIQGLLFCLLN